MDIQRCLDQLDWMLDRLSKGNYTVRLDTPVYAPSKSYESYYEEEAAKWEIQNGRFVRKGLK